MFLPKRYWQIRILPIRERVQLKHHKEIYQAKEFFQIQFPRLTCKHTLSREENQLVQTVLWEIFRFTEDIHQRAIAGLCLRCYVSHRIFITCKNIPHIYNISGENLFSYTDLLPLVLNDNGKEMIILDREGKIQYILNHHDGTTQAIAKEGEFFSVKILQRFNPYLANKESLDNWTSRLTRQNEEIRSFLWEFGLATPSDWGLLCKYIPRSLSDLLSTEDREIIKAFQSVYRRDRVTTQQKGRCFKPTLTQLQEMLHLLQQKNINISTQALISHLKDIAEILRQDWLYKKTGSIKTISTGFDDNSTNNYLSDRQLPAPTDSYLEDVELENLQKICQDLFEQVLYNTIVQIINQRTKDLQKSKGYKNFAQRFKEGLQLYYQENKPLSEIAKIWEIEWSKARRIFKLEDFLEIVQYRTEEAFLDELLQSMNKDKLTKVSHDPDRLKYIQESIREFVWNKTFKEAKAELKASKKQVKNSLLAQNIRIYLSELS